VSQDASKPISEIVQEAKRHAAVNTIYVVDSDKVASLEDVKLIFKSLSLLIKPTNPHFEMLSHLLTEKKEYDSKATKK
jgi:hypothetical protein